MTELGFIKPTENLFLKELFSAPSRLFYSRPNEMIELHQNNLIQRIVLNSPHSMPIPSATAAEPEM